MTLFQVVPEGKSRDTVAALWAGTHRRRSSSFIFRKEKVAFTGDMMTPGLAHMGDGHVDGNEARCRLKG